ncbi:MAG: hypothetical protein J6S57_01460 [Alphaproteobacteria bacterium]|nr:hypothetical protein [Alphaproteobacteria bacterium]
MYLRYITCSDPREHNKISEIIDLGCMPLAEVAVQCHPSKMSDGMPRNVWFRDLLHAAYNVPSFNLAIHINNEWANDICVKGEIPAVLKEWIYARNSQSNPIIKRIQLNMPLETAQNINTSALAHIIAGMPRREFILQYNDKTKWAVEKLHQTNARFSLLFDASGGQGKQPESWQKPIYETHPTGYSGGISPDNVVHNLQLINTLVPKNTDIWIDAEGRLKSNDPFDEKPKFDIKKAQLYVTHAKNWEKQR